MCKQGRGLRNQLLQFFTSTANLCAPDTKMARRGTLQPLLLWAVFAFLAGVVPGVATGAVASEVSALLDIKAALDPQGNLLSSWMPGTDPCADDWIGVKCNCFPFFENAGKSNSGTRPVACAAPPDSNPRQHVLQVNLGDPRISQGIMMSGSFPAKALQKLTELRVLNLASHSLSGPVPSTLTSLTALERLVLSNNRLSGKSPTSFISQLQKILSLHAYFSLLGLLSE
jgi:hypothetical protein